MSVAVLPIIMRVILLSLRIGSIFISTPFFSSNGFVSKPKIIFILFLTILFYPVIPTAWLPVPPTFALFIKFAVGELVVGLILGLIFNILFAGVQLAGQVMGFEIGYSLVRTIDPTTAVETVVLSVMWNLIALFIFLMLNGHHMVIRALIKSYQTVPAGTLVLTQQSFESVVKLSGQMFVIGIQLAAPVLVLEVVVDVVIGFIGRAAPFIHMLIIGFPFKILVGLLAMGFSLYLFPMYMQSALSALWDSFLKIASFLV